MINIPKDIKNIFLYSILTFVVVRLIKYIYIAIHNFSEEQQWPYIYLIFEGNPNIDFNIMLTGLILAPIFETLMLHFFFLKTSISPKYQILVFAMLFALYHYITMGLYGALYTFMVGIIFAYQYHSNCVNNEKEVAIKRAVLTHALVNAVSFFA